MATALAFFGGTIVGCVLAGYAVFRQSGRVLLRLQAIEAELASRQTVEDSPRGRTADDEHSTDSVAVAGSRINRSGLPPGTPAPDFSLPTIDGSGVRSLREWKGRPFVLVFASADCGPCDVLTRRLSQLNPNAAAQSILMVARGSKEAAKFYALPFPVVVQEGWQISRLYGTFQVPTAYAIDSEGIVRSKLAVGPDAALALACDALADQQSVAPLSLRNLGSGITV